MKRKFFLRVSLVLSMVFVLIPNSQIHAQTFLGFGGVVSFPLPCTCSATEWIWFTPLDLGGPAPYIAGPLVYSPYSTILYSNFSPGVPLYQHIGDYIPGVQACWMYAGVFCFPLPNIGLMFQLGTS